MEKKEVKGGWEKAKIEKPMARAFNGAVVT